MKPTTPLRFAGIDFVRTGQLKQNGLAGVLTFVNSGREIRESDRDDQRSWRELEYVGGEETRQRISSARRQPSGTRRGTDPMLSVWRRDRRPSGYRAGRGKQRVDCLQWGLEQPTRAWIRRQAS